MNENQAETKQQLIEDIVELRLRINELERFQTDYGRMKEELHHLASVQSSILNNKIMGIAFVRHRIFEWANPRLADLLGLPQNEVQGAGVRFIYASNQEFEDYGRKIYQVLSRGESFEFAHAVTRPDGRLFTARIIGKALNPSSVHEGSIWILEDITDRIRAEAALKESEAQYRLLVDNSNDLIWTINAEGELTYASPSWKRTMGYSPSDVVGKRFDLYVHPDDVDRCARTLQDTITLKKEMQGIEYRVQHADGVWHWHETSGRPVFGPDGIFLSFVGVARDITDRKLAIEELEKSQSRLAGIIEFLPDAAVVIDRNGRIIAWNRAMEEMMGITKKEALGRKNCADTTTFYGERRKYLLDLIDSDDTELESRYQYVKRKGNVVYAEAYAPALYGGKGAYIFAAAAPLFDSLGNRFGVIESIRDVTDYRRAEEELREAHKRLDEIIANLPDATFVIDAEGKIIAWNRAIEEMTGIRTADMLGQGDCEYALPFYGQRRPMLIDLALNPQSECAAQYPGLKEKGSVFISEAYMPALRGREAYLSGRASALRDSKGHIIGAVETMRDITEQRRLEVQLRQAQKMEAIGTLAGGIAHDFNNILASMIGFTEMAARESRKEVRQKYHERVFQACSRAKNLISQILTFSRGQEQEFKPLNVKLILKEALNLLRATLPATIEIRHLLTREETYVQADPTQLHQVLINLCTNAAHAMREKGGFLDIRLSAVEIQYPERALHSDLSAGAYVALSVGDTGHGIDPNVRDKIFDPFFTTKNAREGTGLGLSVVYGIVKSSGGAIDVQSEVGRGSTFTIYLPRIAPAGNVEEKRRDAMDLSGNERILFVDDEESLVALARAFFESRGYRITAQVKSREALEQFREHPDHFDLVITDLIMPDMTGVELARELLALRPDLPIILCTGYSDSVGLAQVRKLNIRELVFKPVAPDDLGRLVRRILDG